MLFPIAHFAAVGTLLRVPNVYVYSRSYGPCVWRIATRAHLYRSSRCESGLSLTLGTHLVAGKRSDRGSALRLGNTERFLGVPSRSTEYRSKGESLINQAATGVWYRARQWGCQRIECRFAIG